MCFGVFIFGPLEFVLIFGIVILLFGGNRLPKLGRSFGEMIANFKSSKKEDTASQADKKETEERNIK